MQPGRMYYYSGLLLIPLHLPPLNPLPRPFVFEVIVFVEESVKELHYWSLPVSVAASLPSLISKCVQAAVPRGAEPRCLW